eukprot:CAMPEP_0185848170 /NCGR_PEP_ID=MMETSP1354-20130828/3154_1 /TAXON_ID=708628 /ORGANISM="Erythrolobus madagascarensis, Strain CCMP3276" /LENGTH=129 /DNA_ID=CAMNT_0028548535 /DNA_START=421 /DNA_END=810 /DNA_ORIENTATION=+
MGWVYKRGRSWGVRQLRYFRLHKGVLSNHVDEYADATWSVTVSECSVTVNAERGNIDIATGGPSIRIHPIGTVEFQSWARALTTAAAVSSTSASANAKRPADVVAGPESNLISTKTVLTGLLNGKKLLS